MSTKKLENNTTVKKKGALIMTIGGWIFFGFLGLCVLGCAIAIGATIMEDNKVGGIVVIIAGLALTIGIYAGFSWYYSNTESGQRAFKTQESNLGGGIERTVTVYSYDGDEIKSWTGKFDVTENDQETYFDIDGKRVIIQGGIIINEENSK